MTRRGGIFPAGGSGGGGGGGNSGGGIIDTFSGVAIAGLTPNLKYGANNNGYNFCATHASSITGISASINTPLAAGDVLTLYVSINASPTGATIVFTDASPLVQSVTFAAGTYPYAVGDIIGLTADATALTVDATVTAGAIVVGSTSGSGSVTLSGDATGPSGSTTVVGIQNNIIGNTPSTTNNTLTYNGTTVVWAPSSASPLKQDNAVFYDAQFGDDATGLRESRTFAFKTLQAAVNAASNGDSVFLLSSVNEAIVVPGAHRLHFVGIGAGATEWTAPAGTVPLTSVSGGIIQDVDFEATGAAALVISGPDGSFFGMRGCSYTSDQTVAATFTNLTVFFDDTSPDKRTNYMGCGNIAVANARILSGTSSHVMDGGGGTTDAFIQSGLIGALTCIGDFVLSVMPSVTVFGGIDTSGASNTSDIAVNGTVFGSMVFGDHGQLNLDGATCNDGNISIASASTPIIVTARGLACPGNITLGDDVTLLAYDGAFNWQNVSLGAGAFLRWQNKYDATVAPTVSDDETQGFRVGSEWGVQPTALWKCISAAAGSAVWVRSIAKVGPERTAYVDAVGGNDTSAVIGHQELPYQTVQAAVNAIDALASPNMHAVALSPVIVESIVIPSSLASIKFISWMSTTHWTGVTGVTTIDSTSTSVYLSGVELEGDTASAAIATGPNTTEWQIHDGGIGSNDNSISAGIFTGINIGYVSPFMGGALEHIDCGQVVFANVPLIDSMPFFRITGTTVTTNAFFVSGLINRLQLVGKFEVNVFPGVQFGNDITTSSVDPASVLQLYSLTMSGNVTLDAAGTINLTGSRSIGDLVIGNSLTAGYTVNARAMTVIGSITVGNNVQLDIYDGTFNWDNVTLGTGASLRWENNFAATVGPTVNDDNTLGFRNGSRWTTPTSAWIASDVSTGAAVWQQVGSGGSVTLNGDAVGPASANTVVGIQNVPVTAGVPANTSVVLAGDGLGGWAPKQINPDNYIVLDGVGTSPGTVNTLDQAFALAALAKGEFTISVKDGIGSTTIGSYDLSGVHLRIVGYGSQPVSLTTTPVNPGDFVLVSSVSFENINLTHNDASNTCPGLFSQKVSTGMRVSVRNGTIRGTAPIGSYAFGATQVGPVVFDLLGGGVLGESAIGGDLSSSATVTINVFDGGGFDSTVIFQNLANTLNVNWVGETFQGDGTTSTWGMPPTYSRFTSQKYTTSVPLLNQAFDSEAIADSTAPYHAGSFYCPAGFVVVGGSVLCQASNVLFPLEVTIYEIATTNIVAQFTTMAGSTTLDVVPLTGWTPPVGDMWLDVKFGTVGGASLGTLKGIYLVGHAADTGTFPAP